MPVVCFSDKKKLTDTGGDVADGFSCHYTVMIPDAASLSEALKDIFGQQCQIEHEYSVSGGDINACSVVTMTGGERVFLKRNTRNLKAMFASEALGLETLGTAADHSAAPGVPRPLAWGTDGQHSFLVMQHVISGGTANGTEFGTALAELHRQTRSTLNGFEEDNWIGSSRQVNTQNADWIQFFADNRLRVQWNMLRGKGYGNKQDSVKLDTLCRKLSSILPVPDQGKASLLHGDLWGGNWLTGPDSKAMLIDPAVYFGHREADLAMTELFGGFPSGFRKGYEDCWPLEPGFNERRDVYNLYHLMNHANLFGASYWSSVVSILDRYC